MLFILSLVFVGGYFLLTYGLLVLALLWIVSCKDDGQSIACENAGSNWLSISTYAPIIFFVGLILYLWLVMLYVRTVWSHKQTIAKSIPANAKEHTARVIHFIGMCSLLAFPLLGFVPVLLRELFFVRDVIQNFFPNNGFLRPAFFLGFGGVIVVAIYVLTYVATRYLYRCEKKRQRGSDSDKAS